MIVRILTILGSVASLTALVFMIRPPGQPLTATQGAFLGAAVCLLLATITLEVKDYCSNRPVALDDETKINNYMHKWISSGGQVVIFSHDMSWAEGDEMRQLLRLKAERDELCLCLPREIPLAQELKELGAELCTYPELGYVPQARFTIVNRGRMDARVAVGRRIKDKHIIEEFSMGEHPVFSVANDLSEIITRLNRCRGNYQEA